MTKILFIEQLVRPHKVTHDRNNSAASVEVGCTKCKSFFHKRSQKNMKWDYLCVGIKQNAWFISSKSKSAAKWTISYQLSLYCQFILTIAPAETKMGLGQNVSL